MVEVVVVVVVVVVVIMMMMMTGVCAGGGVSRGGGEHPEHGRADEAVDDELHKLLPRRAGRFRHPLPRLQPHPLPQTLRRLRQVS